MLLLLLVFLGQSALAESSEIRQFRKLAHMSQNPDAWIKKLGVLKTQGTASLDKAQIIFLPEIHDDPKSLTLQLLILAREKKLGRKFLVLDESLKTLRRSRWDVFTQKALEIVAARKKRRLGESYSPSRFEATLRKLATKLKRIPGELRNSGRKNLRTLKNFAPISHAFYGWDTGKRNSLTTRNIQMVDSLKKVINNNFRIFVMAGARHIPELEYHTSQWMLCKNNKSSNIDDYFSNIKNLFGNSPKLKRGIGATLPIYNFLRQQKYAVVFSQDINQELRRALDKVINNNSCYKLK